MAAVTIRNIPEATHEALKRLAKRNGRSTEAEIRLILEREVVRSEHRDMGSQLRQIGRDHGWLDDVTFERDQSEPRDTIEFE